MATAPTPLASAAPRCDSSSEILEEATGRCVPKPADDPRDLGLVLGIAGGTVAAATQTVLPAAPRKLTMLMAAMALMAAIGLTVAADHEVDGDDGGATYAGAGLAWLYVLAVVPIGLMAAFANHFDEYPFSKGLWAKDDPQGFPDPHGAGYRTPWALFLPAVAIMALAVVARGKGRLQRSRLTARRSPVTTQVGMTLGASVAAFALGLYALWAGAMHSIDLGGEAARARFHLLLMLMAALFFVVVFTVAGVPSTELPTGTATPAGIAATCTTSIVPILCFAGLVWRYERDGGAFLGGWNSWEAVEETGGWYAGLGLGALLLLSGALLGVHANAVWAEEIGPDPETPPDARLL